MKEIGVLSNWCCPYAHLSSTKFSIRQVQNFLCNVLMINLQVHTKKRNRLTTTRLNKLVFIQFNSKMMSKKQKIKSKKIDDVLLSSDTSEAQGFLHEDGHSCALIVYRDEHEEDVMPGTGIPWSVLGDAVGAEEQLELRRSTRVRQLYEEEYFESEEEEFDEDDDDY